MEETKGTESAVFMKESIARGKKDIGSMSRGVQFVADCTGFFYTFQALNKARTVSVYEGESSWFPEVRLYGWMVSSVTWPQSVNVIKVLSAIETQTIT
jgi:hypothetical protein